MFLLLYCGFDTTTSFFLTTDLEVPVYCNRLVIVFQTKKAMSNKKRKLGKKSTTCCVINYFIDLNNKELELL